jgi:hypothetical protein
MRTAILAIGLAMACTAGAGTVYKCTDGQGQVAFSDTECGPEQTLQERTHIRIEPSGWNGAAVMDRNRELLRDHDRRRKIGRGGGTAAPVTQPAPIGFTDRLRIRELEMERQRLDDELADLRRRGLGGDPEARVIGSGILSLDRRIEQIRRRPTGQ